MFGFGLPLCHLRVLVGREHDCRFRKMGDVFNVIYSVLISMLMRLPIEVEHLREIPRRLVRDLDWETLQPPLCLDE
jgi:hypothetical protein